MFLVAWAPFRRDNTKVTPGKERSCWAAFGNCWTSGRSEGWRDYRVQHGQDGAEAWLWVDRKSHLGGKRHRDFAKGLGRTMPHCTQTPALVSSKDSIYRS